MLGKIVEDESCSSKTVFSVEVDDNVEAILRLRSLRYADEVYLKIYHNRMHPSEDHPDCPVEMRGYLSLLFYGINYVPEISRCIKLLREMSEEMETALSDPLKIHFNVFTSEISPIWRNGLEIVRQDLPRHLKCAVKDSNLNWSIFCHDTVCKSEDGVNVMVSIDRHDIYAGDIVLDMACDCGELILEVLRNYDCFCIAMSPKIDQLAMAEVNWVGLQNHLKKEAGSRARHLQFIAAEFNKGSSRFLDLPHVPFHCQESFAPSVADFFNFNVVNKILCSLPLRWWKAKGDTLDLYYDKLFTIISKCRQETHSVLLIPLTKDHKKRVNEASRSSKYNFQVLAMRRLITLTTQMYVCLLETKLPRLAFPERNRGVDFLMQQDSLLPHTLDLSVPQSPLLGTSHAMSLPPVGDHFIRNSLCLPMLHSTSSLDLQHTSTSLGISISRPPLELPPLSSDRIIGSSMFDFLLDDASVDDV
ncbi:hypothetical protein ANCDUO_14869 [Ancylostoma duodenale]|uniref:Uncharacterized protein n=1 Tax=Ancylostoma duodenale TaxID=51022 RepID=A0A0C2CF80_9BILA|nr:hypothetical protein ANCDUO_14869 [Ancylostoma duodenale]